MSIPPPPGPHQPQDAQGPYPQGPYAPPPYPAWGQAPGPYGRPAPVNGIAIAALVLGLLCFLPAVGLVLGLIALGQIRRKGERGKGLAVAGAVLSSIGLALWVVSLSTGAVGAFWDGLKEASKGEGTAYSLAKGECFDAPGGSLEGFTYDVDEVPCKGEHDGEVFAAVKVPGGSYPGDEKVTRIADDKCYALQHTYAMDTWAVPEDVDVYYLTPTRQSWRLGDREITCVFGNSDAKGTLTGSLRNDETTLDADQVAYLKAARVLDTALDSAPEETYVEDDLPGHKAWAGRVASALAEQAGMLDGHTWPADAGKPLADLVDDLNAAEGEWADASDATDVDTFYEHYDKGSDLIDPHKSVTARKALGLATTPPSYEEEDSGDGGGTDAEV
ncbi:DUF4190 domain-containing protein [Streptomyces sp. S.PNR 29]|uniref:DUF4190 domain-containing protein n=1 Tax=Streptomyces sp. S.PNR 29 TaxID=2973805 RepID=UPI0025B0DD7F|nr:DUF4190 domain-containing protein [Streptomyces sp. S.PNR 29]MDN0195523.1 DUF4190 domain-containing protein [Streptomyces sp. S.PNR 29]